MFSGARSRKGGKGGRNRATAAPAAPTTRPFNINEADYVGNPGDEIDLSWGDAFGFAGDDYSGLAPFMGMNYGDAGGFNSFYGDDFQLIDGVVPTLTATAQPATFGTMPTTNPNFVPPNPGTVTAFVPKQSKGKKSKKSKGFDRARPKPVKTTTTTSTTTTTTTTNIYPHPTN